MRVALVHDYLTQYGGVASQLRGSFKPLGLNNSATGNLQRFPDPIPHRHIIADTKKNHKSISL